MLTLENLPLLPGRKECEQILNQAFSEPRTPRSPEYKEGVISVLLLKIAGYEEKCPYELGTCHADAYYSGCQEGHRIAHEFGR